MEDAQFLQELYDIIKAHGDGGYEDVISAKSSYLYLYHLSEVRQNLIDWIPMDKSMHVLERNPECGALTGKLLEKAGKVTCVARDEAHANIIRLRYKNADERLEIVTEEQFGNAAEQVHFDVICVVGDFYRFAGELKALRERLSPQGRLYAADANRLGLKYFAGCAEDYSGEYFRGIEGLEARSYSRSEYTKVLSDAGFGKLEFYYPYPDYKFPNCIYSDAWLPGQGELSDNRRNFDRDRLQLFDERKAYDTLLKEGLFGSFSNSYLIEAGV